MQTNLSLAEKQTVKTTRNKLIQAVRIMKMQPLTQRDRPARVQALWVAYSNQGPATSAYRQPIRPKASPEQIKEMHRWLDSLLRLDATSRRIVMARAGGIPWRRLEEMDGRSHTTLRKIESLALLKLASSAEDTSKG